MQVILILFGVFEIDTPTQLLVKAVMQVTALTSVPTLPFPHTQKFTDGESVKKLPKLAKRYELLPRETDSNSGPVSCRVNQESVQQ